MLSKVIAGNRVGAVVGVVVIMGGVITTYTT